ncbi:MAG TPA: aminoglycoside phosphotransferase family protein [Gaiellaceae bacterium]|nr:aminoglycoside phosphotransferase family protein [Gaiellaceae bacterium]
MIEVPAGLSRWRGEPGGAAWLDRLPSLVAECAEAWSLRLGRPFEPATISLVVPAKLPDGRRAVLKLNFPEPESEQEAEALAHWRGQGAVRLLAADAERRALLVERADPGTQLWERPDDEASRALAAVLRLLHRDPPPPRHPFRLLGDEARRWTDAHPQLRATVADLLAGETPDAVLHQDLHGGNVLLTGDGWAAIDPKPLVGDPAFDVASLVRDRRPVRDRRLVSRRLDLLHDELGYDRERMRAWSWVHALAWGHPAEARLLA